MGWPAGPLASGEGGDVQIRVRDRGAAESGVEERLCIDVLGDGTDCLFGLHWRSSTHSKASVYSKGRIKRYEVFYFCFDFQRTC